MNNFIWIEPYRAYINIYSITASEKADKDHFRVKMADGDYFYLSTDYVDSLLGWGELRHG